MSLLEEVLVHLHDVAIGYDVPLIEDINIEVIAGDVIAVLGPSGIGKTTLLRTIAGLVRPLEGDCLLYTSPSPRDKRQSRMPSSA